MTKILLNSVERFSVQKNPQYLSKLFIIVNQLFSVPRKVIKKLNTKIIRPFLMGC
jgi:hypothetical protein